MRRGTATNHLLIAILPLIACVAVSGCDDDPENTETTAPATEEPGATQPDAAADPDDEPEQETTQDTATDPAPPPRDPDEREVAQVVRTYLLGLDAGDGERVCSALAPGAIDEIELPESGGDCAASLSDSIGYRDPRGVPVFEGLKLAGIRAIEIEADSARARATTVTTFADRKEPSIEDDLVYLTRAGVGWRIAKPSAALYRAIGTADVPPSVLAPPDAG
ncbi:MAG: hypothetical protein ACRDK9_03505 [Solirubrobacterales bacterium]